jgi:hypothetical protein
MEPNIAQNPENAYNLYIVSAYGIALLIIGWMWLKSMRLNRYAEATLQQLEKKK